ncbi:type VI secretion system tube protein TssD [Bacteroides sp. 224]|uniref:type VI secretion system tube protein TssD n=1 Tax=Bacteroides sp. 224 TaxID=2302936 RepID=UPI0013D282FC|nr:type VI secretion system tube protein TssD [Bacteroides sp. 224]NDV64645.1 type VI secretion system needle protein Hcp [Bacteroides sp. 224]
MFGHKSFLKIGELSDASIMGLYKDSYELDHCSYNFSQGVNSDGKAQTEVRGGMINIVIPGIPPLDIIGWALDARKYNNGMIVICDDNDMPLEKIKFTDAACIAMDISYQQQGEGYIGTKLTLQTRVLSVGQVSLNKRWSGFE